MAEGLHGADAGGSAGWAVGCGYGDGQEDEGGGDEGGGVGGLDRTASCGRSAKAAARPAAPPRMASQELSREITYLTQQKIKVGRAGTALLCLVISCAIWEGLILIHRVIVSAEVGNVRLVGSHVGIKNLRNYKKELMLFPPFGESIRRNVIRQVRSVYTTGKNKSDTWLRRREGWETGQGIDDKRCRDCRCRCGPFSRIG